MKKSAVILIVVVTLAIVVGIAAALIPVFAPPTIVSDDNQLDLESPSTTMTPVPIDDNIYQKRLQEITADYATMERAMVDMPQNFKISDFCSELIINQEIYQGQTRTYLTSKTGFYIGPILLLDENGNEVYHRSIIMVAFKGCEDTIPNEFKDCTIITLDKINPELAKNYPYFLPE